MINRFGITLKLHPLFILIMLASIWTGDFLELFTLFAIVLVHEFGHAAAARGFGWTIREIMLLPFGGVAVVEDSNCPAWQELAVAAAGPLQNAWMAALGWLFGELGWWGPEWAAYFIRCNLLIGCFNLLPILPLDGGKMLQALLSLKLPFHQALFYGSRISLLLSALLTLAAFAPLGGAGIQLNLLLIGIFLIYSNWFHRRALPFHFFRFLLGRDQREERWLSKGTLAQPIVVKKHRRIGQIMQLFRKEKYHLIYILNDTGTIQTVIPEQRIIAAALNDKKSDSAVSELFM